MKAKTRNNNHADMELYIYPFSYTEETLNVGRAAWNVVCKK